MKLILLIGLGSFLGGITRYLLTVFVQNKIFSSFPFGTLIVNIIGCFIIGIVFGISERGNLNTEWKLFLTTGILGGFTTFSAFSHDTISLFREGQPWFAMVNVGISIILGLAATVAGISITKMI